MIPETIFSCNKFTLSDLIAVGDECLTLSELVTCLWEILPIDKWLKHWLSMV